MKKFITDITLANKKVLIRVDLNVPISDRGRITSKKRIVEVLPTIQYVLDQGGKAILFSHLGRVKTIKDLKTKTLAPVAKALAEELGISVQFVGETRGPELEAAIENLRSGEILLIENTRFEDLNNNSESGNNLELAEYWASLGDVFINDAFATSHRSHASNVGIASFIRESGIGFLVRKELQNISKIIDNPEEPFVAIVGGAKVSDKIELLEILIEKVDRLIIGGAMSYTFLAAQGIGVGESLIEEDKVDMAREFLKKYANKLVLPIDHALSKTFSNEEPIYNNDNPLEIPHTFMALDVGPKTSDLIDMHIKGSTHFGFGPAKSIYWNGPLGVAEFSNYRTGTHRVVEAIASLADVFSVVGGGDSVAAIEALDATHNFSHVSTGGGASLTLIQGKPLPGIDVIQEDDFVLEPEKVEEEFNDVFAVSSIDDYLESQSNIEETAEVEQDLVNILSSSATQDVMSEETAAPELLQTEEMPYQSIEEQYLEQQSTETAALSSPTETIDGTTQPIDDPLSSTDEIFGQMDDPMTATADEIIEPVEMPHILTEEHSLSDTMSNDLDQLDLNLQYADTKETVMPEGNHIPDSSSASTVELEEALLNEIDADDSGETLIHKEELLSDIDATRESFYEDTNENEEPQPDAFTEEEVYSQNTSEGLEVEETPSETVEENYSSTSNLDDLLEDAGEISATSENTNEEFDEELLTHTSEGEKTTNEILDEDDGLFNLAEEEEDILEDDLVEEKPKKRGWFARLFGKK